MNALGALFESFTILHLLGVALGVGGAFVSDAIFLTSAKDKVFSTSEIKYIRLASKIVWIGLFIIICSGIAIFFTDPERYIASTKFLAKMTIVAILTINGLIFHIKHIPRIRRHANEHFPSSDDFGRHRLGMMISGALSSSSWLSALALGSLPKLPFSYTQIMTVYGLVVFCAIIGAIFLAPKILPKR